MPIELRVYGRCLYTIVGSHPRTEPSEISLSVTLREPSAWANKHFVLFLLFCLGSEWAAAHSSVVTSTLALLHALPACLTREPVLLLWKQNRPIEHVLRMRVHMQRSLSATQTLAYRAGQMCNTVWDCSRHPRRYSKAVPAPTPRRRPRSKSFAPRIAQSRFTANHPARQGIATL